MLSAAVFNIHCEKIFINYNINMTNVCSKNATLGPGNICDNSVSR